MKFEEVKNTFFEYEDKRHKILQDTQKYFIERGFQCYVWFDEEHRLRVKYKYRRGLTFDEVEKKKSALWEVTEQFLKENDLESRFIFDFCEADRTLPIDVQSQWSTEFIIEV